MYKTRLFIFALIILSACAKEPTEKNIYTGEAFSKYSKELEGKLFLAFPEARENPLKWFDSIPENRLTDALDNRQVKLDARPGEVFVYQVGVWAINRNVNDLQVEFSDLKG